MLLDEVWKDIANEPEFSIYLERDDASNSGFFFFLIDKLC